jgi:polyisoprenoid-binding protein YceI
MTLRKLTFIALLLFTAQFCAAQKYICKNGHASIFSETPVENIEALTKELSSIYDSKTGEVVIAIPIKSFKFDKSLMEEHFNENYLESDKYPKAIFKGKIIEASTLDISKDGTYKVNAEGKLTIHNVTKDVKIPGSISIKKGIINMNATFSVRCADYAIKIPKIVLVKVAEVIEVTINNSYSPL